MERTQQQPKQSKEQSSRGMTLQTSQKQRQLSSSNTANELNTLSHAKQELKVNDKDVDFLVKQLGVDKIKATNVLKKLDLKHAVKYIIEN